MKKLLSLWAFFFPLGEDVNWNATFHVSILQYMKCFILLDCIPYFASWKAGEAPEQQDWMGVSIVAAVTMKKLNKAKNKTGEDEGMQVQCSTKGRKKEMLSCSSPFSV